jgi:hypothetical protein
MRASGLGSPRSPPRLDRNNLGSFKLNLEATVQSGADFFSPMGSSVSGLSETLSHNIQHSVQALELTVGGSPTKYVRSFSENYAKLMWWSKFVLCLDDTYGVSWWRLAPLLFVFSSHVLVTSGTMVMRFQHHATDLLNIISSLKSFEFISALVALLSGLLCAWWFVLTRALVRETLRGKNRPVVFALIRCLYPPTLLTSPTAGVERIERHTQEAGRTRQPPPMAGSAVAVGFGWDFFVCYSGSLPGAADLGPSLQCGHDALHFASNLCEQLNLSARAKNARYPTGAFVDSRQLTSQLAALRQRSARMGTVSLLPGKKLGFHICPSRAGCMSGLSFSHH